MEHRVREPNVDAANNNDEFLESSITSQMPKCNCAKRSSDDNKDNSDNKATGEAAQLISVGATQESSDTSHQTSDVTQQSFNVALVSSNEATPKSQLSSEEAEGVLVTSIPQAKLEI